MHLHDQLYQVFGAIDEDPCYSWSPSSPLHLLVNPPSIKISTNNSNQNIASNGNNNGFGAYKPMMIKTSIEETGDPYAISCKQIGQPYPPT